MLISSFKFLSLLLFSHPATVLFCPHHPLATWTGTKLSTCILKNELVKHVLECVCGGGHFPACNRPQILSPALLNQLLMQNKCLYHTKKITASFSRLFKAKSCVNLLLLPSPPSLQFPSLSRFRYLSHVPIPTPNLLHLPNLPVPPTHTARITREIPGLPKIRFLLDTLPLGMHRDLMQSRN